MRIRRLLVVITIAALLGTGVTAPRRAEADNIGIIVAASVIGWFGLVILATYLLRNRDSSFSQSSVSPLVGGQQFTLRPVADPKIRFGASCGKLAEGPSLLCW